MEKKVVPRRRTMREFVFKVIYQYDFTKDSLDEIFKYTLENDKLDPLSVKEAWEFAKGIIENIDEIDSLIKSHLINWTFERLSSIDKNILRLGTYELLFKDDIPIEVTLNEAIEIAKKFGSEKSGKFVNGILDRIAKEYAPKHKFDL
jgi:N utilization substance protein B